jgi:putative membrane protein
MTLIPAWLPDLPITRRLVAWMILPVVYTVAVAVFVHALALPQWTAGNEVAASLGVVIGILLVFRTNSANDRWWEARKLWGQLINDSRNLALKARAHAAVGPEEHRDLARLLAGFAHALRLHLRGVGKIQSVPGFEKEPADPAHAPGYVAGRIHQLVDHWNRQGQLRDTVLILDVHARALMDVCGACERIRNTPLPPSYRSLLRWGLVLYILVAPWSVSLEMGWWCIPTLAVGFCFLLAIELTDEEVEEPFGGAKDDLPLESYCQTIEAFVFAALATDSFRGGV